MHAQLYHASAWSRAQTQARGEPRPTCFFSSGVYRIVSAEESAMMSRTPALEFKGPQHSRRAGCAGSHAMLWSHGQQAPRHPPRRPACMHNAGTALPLTRAPTCVGHHASQSEQADIEQGGHQQGTVARDEPRGHLRVPGRARRGRLRRGLGGMTMGWVQAAPVAAHAHAARAVAAVEIQQRRPTGFCGSFTASMSASK